MITIRSSSASSKPTLIGLEVILTTARGTYTISSNGSVADFSSPFGGGLFGAISWPRSQFRLAPGVVLEQQMFFPNDGDQQLHSPGNYTLNCPCKGGSQSSRSFPAAAHPRSYRDLGFHFDPEENGGRLTWLPNVRGPKVIADTNGEYHNDPTRFIECSRAQETESTSSENLVAPGTFEFELSSCPSVLIFSMEGDAKTKHAQHVGLSGRSHAKRRSFKNGFGWQFQVRRGDGCAARGRSIMNQIYFRPATSIPEKTIRSGPRSFRSNRMIDRALRKAYRKYDRSRQTQSLLRRYLLG
jgi:hypothetical protein